MSDKSTRLRALSVPRHTCNHCSACCSSFKPMYMELLPRRRAAIATEVAERNVFYQNPGANPSFGLGSSTHWPCGVLSSARRR